MNKCIVYIGDFDLRNENVQAHLVKNNGKIFNQLGYHIEYIGINRETTSFQTVASLPTYQLNEENHYLELPYTLNIKGVLRTPRICKVIINRLKEISTMYEIAYVITYQSPTYAIAINEISKWCKRNSVLYVVNCADLPIFDLQSPFKRLVMKANWMYLHYVNHKYADGVIAVSNYINNFFYKKGRNSVVIPPLFNTEDFDFIGQANDVSTFVYAGQPFVLTQREASPEGMKDRLDKIIDIFLSLSKMGIKYVFNIIGITKEDYLAGVPRHATSLMEERQIRFLGKYNHKDTLRMVALADFSINYRDENLMTKAGFSTKIVESVSVGTPVIINSISDTFVYLQDGRDGFMLSGDLDKDIERVKDVCTLTPQERLNMKLNLYEKKIFDAKKYVNAMDSFINSLEFAKGNQPK